MRVLLIVLAVIGIGVLAFYVFFPANAFMMFKRPGGGLVVVGRTSLRIEPPPDRYPTHGFDHIQDYVARLLAPSDGFKSMVVANEAGDRGCGFWHRHGGVEVALSVEWRDEPEREARIRSFFAARQVEASEDYLSDNGGVAGSTRNLTYPLRGNVTEVTEAVQLVLEQLCGVSRSDSLHISYRQQ